MTASAGGVTETRPALDQRLRAAGLRVTSARLAVLEALGPGDHLEVDQIGHRARARLGSLSTQAVYDVLRALGIAGLVRRVEPAGSPALFEARVGDNHHHLVCRACGAVLDVDCLRGRRPCLEPSETHGFLLDEAEVTFWGLCPSCATAGPGPEGAVGPAGTAGNEPVEATNNEEVPA